MTLNYLIVANAPFPEWDDALEADLTYIDKVHDADGWARVIFDHYRDADAVSYTHLTLPTILLV